VLGWLKFREWTLKVKWALQ